MDTKDTGAIDGLSFFTKELEPRRFPYFIETPLAQKLGWRVAGLGAWRGGKITFGWALRNFLPGRYKSEKIQQLVHDFVDERLDDIFRSGKLYERDSVNLFGKPFSPPTSSSFRGWLALFKTLAESIVTDQYHARKFIKKNSIVIDGGAFIGAFSAFAATLAPEGRVYSFEPTPATHAVLQKNISGYQNATAVLSALGDKSGQGEFFVNADVPAANTLRDSGMASAVGDAFSASKEVVKITTIDEFVMTNAISGVDFIKLDAEGYEARILEGAKETIRACKPVMSMSAYHHAGDSVSLPAVVLAIYPGYKWKLNKGLEEDLLFWV